MRGGGGGGGGTHVSDHRIDVLLNSNHCPLVGSVSLPAHMLQLVIGIM